MTLQGDITVSYRPGTWVAFIGLELWILVENVADEGMLSVAWKAVREYGGLSVVERMLREAVDREPRSFTLVAVSGDGLVVLLSGIGTVEVSNGSDPEMRCPSGVSVAQYRLAHRPASLRMKGGPEGDDAIFPIASGIARAAAIQLDWSAAPSQGFRAGSDQLATPIGRTQELGLDPGVTLTGPSTSEERESEVGQAASESLGGGLDGVGAPIQREESNLNESDDGYDHLFGHTVARTVEDAAVRLGEPDPVAPGTATVPLNIPGPPPAPVSPYLGQAPPASPARPPTPQRAATSGLIDSVPWTTSGQAPARGIPHDHELGLTVSRAAQKALLDQLGADPGAVSKDRMIHAVLCPAHHPNPAHAGSCRVCGVTILEQSPVTVPRPALGRLGLSTGDEVSLDRGVLMGRGPTEGRLVGGERPHRVKLPSPGNDISRNHLEVRLDGWHVLVTDLHSTNGTLVTRPGRPPERLRPDQPTMIEPGTVVTLADEVSFTYEVA